MEENVVLDFDGLERKLSVDSTGAPSPRPRSGSCYDSRDSDDDYSDDDIKFKLVTDEASAAAVEAVMTHDIVSKAVSGTLTPTLTHNLTPTLYPTLTPTLKATGTLSLTTRTPQSLTLTMAVTRF